MVSATAGRVLLFLLALSCVLGVRRFVPSSTVLPGDESVVTTADGVVKGVLYPTYRSFQGIPFAEPPVGQLRWAPTQPAVPWAPKILDASQVGHGCPQHCVLPPNTCPLSTSEDCLYLNIYTPRGPSPASGFPVLFFVPGGRFEQGDGGSVLYSGEYIANKTQTILVTTNYRLGVFGFLVTDAYRGNYGIQDQRTALSWVKTNIAAFGGDPTRVTLFGQSAGGTSTSVHLVSPKSNGLFTNAIIESNPFTLPMKTVDEAKDIARYFVSDLGCPWDREDTDDCLKGKSVDAVLDAEYSAQQHIPLTRPVDLFYPWTPVIGDDLPMNPLQAFVQGKYNKVPIIVGTVSEEAWLFIYMVAQKNVSEAEYLGLLLYVFTDDVVSVVEEYPPPSIFYGGDFRPLIAYLGTHYVFRCTNRAVVNAISKYNAGSNVPVYLYEFDHVLSFDAWGPRYPFCVGHVCHGSELPFVFHSAQPYFNFTQGEEQLSQNIIAYWTNFAHTGNPNQGPQQLRAAGLQWPSYQGQGSAQNMRFAVPSSIQANLDAKYCNFWDKIGYNHGV